jgi:hypothetical protein
MVSYPRKGSISRKDDALVFSRCTIFDCGKRLRHWVWRPYGSTIWAYRCFFEAFCQQPLLNSFVKSWETLSNVSVMWNKRWYFWRFKFYISISQHVVTISNILKQSSFLRS